jgi:hypothetical protein
MLYISDVEIKIDRYYNNWIKCCIDALKYYEQLFHNMFKIIANTKDHILIDDMYYW